MPLHLAFVVAVIVVVVVIVALLGLNSPQIYRDLCASASECWFVKGLHHHDRLIPRDSVFC